MEHIASVTADGEIMMLV